MTDVVVRVGVTDPAEETLLAQTIEAFTQWRFSTCRGEEMCEDGPEIMVRTARSLSGVEKTLIFQDRRWAAAFLRFWRVERRRAN